MKRKKRAPSRVSLTDWRSIADEREKYAAYLCSREWCFLKEAVYERANGKCERCGKNPIAAVHHKTYARKYRESLVDLLGICTDCHAFTHAKCDVDPMDSAIYVRKSVYLAGKVSKGCWRHGVVSRLREAYGDCSDQFGTEDVKWPVLQRSIRVSNEGRDYIFDYSGPFFASCDHGCYHGPHSHGIDRDGCSGPPVVSPLIGTDNHEVLLDSSRIWSQGKIHQACLRAIRHSNLFLAWFDSLDAYGTLVELGYAASLIETHVGFSRSLANAHRELWFAGMCGDFPPHMLYFDTQNDFVNFALSTAAERFLTE